MKKMLLFFLPLFILLASCKSEYEAVRTSGDSSKILELANTYFNAGDYTKAISLYELILPTMRGQVEGEGMYYKFADAHFKNSSYILAAHYFKTFTETYGTSDLKEDAMYMTAYSNYKTSPRYKLDQTSSDQAINDFQRFINTYPYSEKVEEANLLIDELRTKKETKEFQSGKLYYDMKKYTASVTTLENMLLAYPGTPNEEEARYLIAKSNHLLAKNSIFTKQEVRYKATLKATERFLKKYPESKSAKEVEGFKINSLEQLKKIENG